MLHIIECKKTSNSTNKQFDGSTYAAWMSSKTISAMPLFSQSMSDGVNKASGASNRSLPNFMTLPSKRFFIIMLIHLINTYQWHTYVTLQCNARYCNLPGNVKDSIWQVVSCPSCLSLYKTSNIKYQLSKSRYKKSV